MKLLDLIEQIIDQTNSCNFNDLQKLEISELERAIRRLNNLTKAIEFQRDRKLKDPTPQEIYTVKEAANRLKVTAQTIYNLTSSGKLKFSKVGDTIRISDENIREYLARK